MEDTVTERETKWVGVSPVVHQRLTEIRALLKHTRRRTVTFSETLEHLLNSYDDSDGGGS